MLQLVYGQLWQDMTKTAFVASRGVLAPRIELVCRRLRVKKIGAEGNYC